MKAYLFRIIIAMVALVPSELYAKSYVGLWDFSFKFINSHYLDSVILNSEMLPRIIPSSDSSQWYVLIAKDSGELLQIILQMQRLQIDDPYGRFKKNNSFLRVVSGDTLEEVLPDGYWIACETLYGKLNVLWEAQIRNHFVDGSVKEYHGNSNDVPTEYFEVQQGKLHGIHYRCSDDRYYISRIDYYEHGKMSKILFRPPWR